MAFRSPIPPRFPAQGARADGSAGRMTDKEQTLPAETTIDEQARATAEGWIADLAENIGQLELKLATLAGFFNEGLGQAVVGAMGLSAAELRQQLPALRQALRDAGQS